jgi:D-xylose transport system ATP-binding protein
MGAGRTELFTAMFGAFGRKTGEIRIEGKSVKVSTPAGSVKNGVFLLPEDRKRYGLVAMMDVKSNTVLASLSQVSKMGVIDANAEVFETTRLVDRLKTKVSSVEMIARNLSGGNQQKVVLQKALMTKPKLMILDEPTRGIDVGAKYEIYKIMNKLIDEGVAIIMISSELEEVLGMSDRILVMSQGRITRELSRSDATQEIIMQASIGGQR